METRCFTTQRCLFIDTDVLFIKMTWNNLKMSTPSFYFPTHQFPFLHALHNHEQYLLGLAFAIVEGLLNSYQKLLSDIIIDHPAKRRFEENTSALFVFTGGATINAHKRRNERKAHPPSSENLCAKDIMSEARPLPSHTTTGTGGSSLRLSRAMEITLGPPSTIMHTRGTP